MSQTKTFYLERGPINPPELHPANEDELIKIYASNDDAMTDLANMDDNEVFATRDNDYLGTVIVDKVEDGNYNPLTSNAVFDYLQDQLELSEWETVSIPTSAATAVAAPYDGFIKGTAAHNQGTGVIGYIEMHVGSLTYGLWSTSNQFATSFCIPIKKGQLYYSNNTSYPNATIDSQQACWYKLRDYSGRS